MTDTKPQSQEQRQSNLAPETHNDEQDDHRSQAQEVAEQAMGSSAQRSPTESAKDPHESGLMGDSTQDVIDHMRDMEGSGRIDMSAYAGEPNHDDDDDKYGEGHNPDDLPEDDS